MVRNDESATHIALGRIVERDEADVALPEAVAAVAQDENCTQSSAETPSCSILSVPLSGMSGPPAAELSRDLRPGTASPKSD